MVSKNKKKELHLLQNKLHKIINNFLNGNALNKPSKLLYPFVDKNHNDFKEILPILKNLNNINEFEKSIKLIENNLHKKLLSSQTYAKILATLHKEFYSSKKLDKNCKNNKSVLAKGISSYESWINKINKKDLKYIRPLLNSRKKLLKATNLIKGFYVHGSLSTHDYIKGWSDVDTLLVTKRGVMNYSSKILQLRKQIMTSSPFFYQIDPYQHHGIFIITEEEMNYYPQHYFPILLFKYSTCLFGAQSLNFNIRKDNIERIKEFENILNQIKTISPKNEYETKFFLSLFLLFPTLYLQAKENFIYKRNSFEEIRKYIKKDFKLINKVSEIRTSWHKRPKTLTKILVKFPNPHIVRLYNKINREKVCNNTKNLISKIKKSNLLKDIKIKELK
jgi:hypothetical protein